VKLLGIISVEFGITDQALIRFFFIPHILEIKFKYNETVHQLFIDFKKLLYNVLTEFGVLSKAKKNTFK
jgi:hypothetical protein